MCLILRVWAGIPAILLKIGPKHVQNLGLTVGRSILEVSPLVAQMLALVLFAIIVQERDAPEPVPPPHLKRSRLLEFYCLHNQHLVYKVNSIYDMFLSNPQDTWAKLVEQYGTNTTTMLTVSAGHHQHLTVLTMLPYVQDVQGEADLKQHRLELLVVSEFQ